MLVRKKVARARRARKGASASIYMGEEGNADNRSGWWNRLKDAFLKTHRSEFEARLAALN